MERRSDLNDEEGVSFIGGFSELVGIFVDEIEFTSFFYSVVTNFKLLSLASTPSFKLNSRQSV